MPDFPKDLGLLLDGVAASEAVDSSGEVLSVKGADISDFVAGRAPLNYEHRSDQSPGASPLDIVGRVLWAKKIYSLKDCDTERQKMFWEKVKLPLIYFVGLLYDKAGHPGAIAAAASLRTDLALGLKPQVAWSVEGSTLLQRDHHLVETVCRKLSLTYRPCNRSVQTGIISDPMAPPGFEQVPEKLDKPTKDLIEEIADRVAAKTEADDLMYRRLGGWSDTYDPTAIDAQELGKALTAGGYNASPGMLTGGSALQREDLGRKVHETSNHAKAALRDWWGGESQKGTPLRQFLKMKLPEASPEFLERFASAVDDYRLKGVGKGQMLKAEDQPLQKKAALRTNPEDEGDAWEAENEGDADFDPSQMKASKQKTTLIVPKKYQELHAKIQGPAPAPTSRGNSYFDPDQGILHTHLGSYHMQIPKDAGYHAILNSPEVQIPHQEAMKHWMALHKLLKAGKLPQEVAMHAALFSGQSPSNPVPMQEIGYSHLQDLMAQGMDPSRKSGVGRKDKKAYLQAVLPGTAHLPEYMKDYWQGPAGDATRDQHGNQNGMLYPQQKWNSVAHYHELHPDLVRLLGEHRDDGAAITNKLLTQKAESKKFDSRARGYEKRHPDDATQPRYQEATGKSGVVGFAPKTVRYLLGMLGAGNIHVPDTHFIRHAFALPGDSQVRREAEAELGRPLAPNEKAYSPNEHLKNVLWYGPNANNIGANMDKYYSANHPAVQMVREKYGKQIEPDQATFPGFWAHWLSIAPHEAMLSGRGQSYTNASNAGTNHGVYWNAVDNILRHYGLDQGVKKSDGEVGLHDPGSAHPGVLALPLHMKTFLAQKAMEKLLGDTPASLFYAQKLLPLLLAESKGRNQALRGEAAIAKAEALTVELQNFVIKLQKADEDAKSGIMRFQGQDVVPGHAVSTTGHEYHILGDTPDHWVGKRVDGGQSVRLPKASAGSGYSIQSLPRPPSPSSVLDVNEHSIPELTRHPEQKALLHGLDLGGKRGHVKSGFHSDEGDSYWLKGPQGNPVLIKKGVPKDDEHEFAPEFGEARREAAYYNLGKEFFGLGDYLTPTAAFVHPVTGEEHVAVQGIPDAEHQEGYGLGRGHGHPEKQETLRALHNAGELDKLALMNKILGNSDRNSQNYMFSKSARGGMKLIDHGYGFDYRDRDEPFNTMELPHYLQSHMYRNDPDTSRTQGWHPTALAWLQGLEPHVLAQHMEAQGIPVDMRTKAMDRLTDLKAIARANPNIPRRSSLALMGTSLVRPGGTRPPLEPRVAV